MSRSQNALSHWTEAGYYVYPVALTETNGKKDNPKFPGEWSNSVNAPEDAASLDFSSGIAIDTGKSGVVVIDVDTSGGKNGFDQLDQAGINLPETPMTVTTWSGGRHFFYRQPEQRVGSRSNVPVKEVDHRGAGGCVFAAPTPVRNSITGRVTAEYELDQGKIIPVQDLPVLPEEFAVLLRAQKAKPRKQGGKVKRREPLREDQKAVLMGFVDRDLAEITDSRDGGRNDVLGRCTLRLANRLLQLGESFDTFRDTVTSAYRDSGGTDFDQVENWCGSAWAKALSDPMDIPRTMIDEMADDRLARMIADRLAKARMNGESVKLLDDDAFVDWTETPPDPEFWVYGIVPTGEQVILYGKPEAGKTFLGLDWGLSIATGRSWFGRSIGPGRVMFMPGEGNTRITSRIHAWMEACQLKPDRGQFLLTGHVPDLMNDRVVEDLSQQVAEREIDVVFIDTLGRAMAAGGGDISSPPDTAHALKNLQMISQYRPKTTPVVLHHPIKDGSMAGAYNLLAGVDVALLAEVNPESGEGSLRHAKNKDGEKTIVAEYQWKKSGRSAVLVPTGGLVYHQPTEVDPYSQFG